MISTPIFAFDSTIQQRPHRGLAAIVVLSNAGVHESISGKALVLAGITTVGLNFILNWLILDRFTQSGWCRRDHAPT